MSRTCDGCRKTHQVEMPCNEHFIESIGCSFNGERFFDCPDYEKRTDSLEKVAVEMLDEIGALGNYHNKAWEDFHDRLISLGVQVDD